MKHAICITIAILALIPAYAQTAAPTTNPSIPAQQRHADIGPRLADAENEPAVTAPLLQKYARCVDGLLLDLANRLRMISEQAEADELTPEDMQTLQLAATRAMIARLETISAVFDAWLAAKDDDEDDDQDSSGAGNDSAEDAPVRVMRVKSTVSVKELMRERGR